VAPHLWEDLVGTKRNVYALLVGIDRYAGSVPNLNGCKNDVAAFSKLLEVRVSAADDHLHLETLVDAKATRSNVIAQFRAHLSKAGPDDVGLFYYSGHGSQEPAPEEFWPVEPDHLDETLVLHDSRTEGQWDLADKELAALISEISVNKPHILVVLDCCHSGSGTRAAGEDGVAARRAPADRRPRPIESFLFAAARATALTKPAEDRAALGDSGWALPGAAHVLLAGCRSNETAKEIAHGGETRGALSVALQNSLAESGAAMTYRDVHRQVSSDVRGRVREQNPQLETTLASDLDLPFLGGTVRPLPDSFVATHQVGGGWIIDGGQMHGIAGAIGNEVTRLSVLDDKDTVIASAEVTSVRPGDSSIKITPDDALKPERSYRAVVVGTPLPPMLVRISGDEAQAAKLNTAIAKRDDAGGPLLLKAAAPGEAAAIEVTATATGFQLAKAGSKRTIAPIATTTDGAVTTLEHIGQWLRVASLHNGVTRLPGDAVTVELVPEDIGQEPLPIEADGGFRLEYVPQGNGFRRRKYTVTVTNHAGRPIWFALLDLTDTYGIYTDALPAGTQQLADKEAHSIPLSAEVPDELWEQGVTEATDLLKLIVSTAEFDPRNLSRNDLDVSAVPPPPSVRGVPASTLDRLLQRVGTRRARPESAEDEAIADWFSRDLLVTAVRPRPGVKVRGAATVEVATGVRVLAHPTFAGLVRLSSAPDATRDLPSAPVPPLLADDPEGAAPFGLVTTRGGEPEADVLVIDADSDGVAKVTAEAPLVLQLDQTLGVDEHVLPFAWDGEFYVPLGFSRPTETGTEIVLQRLSAPVVTTKSLTGSIRILFRKIVGRRIGLPYKYPLLRLASVAGDGTVSYDDNTARIAAAVKQAKAVLLYVHGIIGDTEGMARSSTVTGVSPPPRLIGGQYQAILTFDYENLDTLIESNATSLRELLNEVGLRDNHGKRFDIVAHSMGGLVSRQMLEYVGGVQVTKLITLGTPNGGSPWPTVQKWATAATALAVNSLTAVVWPLTALAAVLSTIEKVDSALDEMEPGSPFLARLADGCDPGVPYTVIIGNRSLIPDRKPSAKALLAKVFGGAVDIAFLGAPNDLAVAVTSAHQVPNGRAPNPTFHEVACDHITFFSTDAGLSALADALL
jgi:hypothetical protein